MNFKSKEEIYETEIHELISQAAEIAKKYKISFIFAADIGRNEDDRPQISTTTLLFEDCPSAFINTKKVLFDGYRVLAPPIDEIIDEEQYEF